MLIQPSAIPARAETAGTDFFYLSDLTGQVNTGWGDPGYDKGLDGKSIVIRDPNAGGADVTYAKGITLHAASQAVYDISGSGFKKFTAVIGICDSSNIDVKDKSSCEFIVKVDGVQLYKSGVIKIGNGNVAVSVDIPANSQTLTLVTTDAGDGNAGDHSVWADAKLYIDPAMLTNLKSISAKTDTQLIDVGDTLPIHVTGVLVNQAAAELSADELSFTSSNPAVATVSDDGIITGVSNGLATITCQATKDNVTVSDSVDLLVGQEKEGSIWSVASPDGSVKTVFAVNQEGSVYYTVVRGDETVLGLSPVGMQTSLGDFKSGLAFQSVTAPAEINETYSVVSHKKEEYINHAFERTISFTKGTMVFSIVVRAYDDGVAFRYQIGTQSGDTQTMTISGENTGFQVPGNSKVWAMPYGTGGSWSYEGEFSERTIETLSGSQSVPLLYETPGGTFALLTEAHLSGQYVGSMVNVENGGLLRVSFTPQQGTTAVNTSAPFESPWRVAIIGDLADIVENTMAENLSPDPDPTIDYSFVEPGIASWTWMVGYKDMQRDPDAIKKYIDLAAELGWKYFILDEGWQPDAPSGSDSKYSGYFDWFDGVVDYADSKGVGLIAWVICDDLNTQAKRDARLIEWKDKGIKGIKVDFFDRETQSRTQLFDDIYKQCAELGLVVNAHGANKPTGEIRTYPNVLTREAIKGQEMGYLSAYQYTVLPFTRTAIGPADVTEKVYAMNDSSTVGFQSAMTVLVQSGLHCFASSAEDIRGSKVYSLYKNLPVVWDDTRLIDGYPGEFTTMVRRSGENWYGASVTVDARNAEFPLDFLGDGEYYAVIYADGSGGRNDLALDVQKVTKDTTLTVPMKQNGGCAVKILKNKPAGVTEVSIPQTAKVEVGNTTTITAETAPANPDIGGVVWTSSNPAVATVDSNGVVTGVSVGTVTITAASLVDRTVKAESAVTVIEKQHKVNTADWQVIRKDNVNIRFNAPNSISINAGDGDVDRLGDIKNMVAAVPADSDFTITVKVNGGMSKSYQTAALFAFTDNSNLIAAMRRYHGIFGGNCFEAMRYEGGFNERTVTDTQKDAPAYLKLQKQGSTFTSYYSYNGTDWTQISSDTAVTSSNVVGKADKNAIKIGVYATAGGSDDVSMTMTFEDFTYSSSAVPATVIPFSSLIGDANGDQTVSASDIVALRGLIAGQNATPAQVSAGDINEDGSLTKEDVALLLGRLDITLGDVSGDHQITPLDVMSIRKLLLDGTVTDSALAAGDLDEDSKLGPVDIMKLRKMLMDL